MNQKSRSERSAAAIYQLAFVVILAVVVTSFQNCSNPNKGKMFKVEDSSTELESSTPKPLVSQKTCSVNSNQNTAFPDQQVEWSLATKAKLPQGSKIVWKFLQKDENEADTIQDYVEITQVPKFVYKFRKTSFKQGKALVQAKLLDQNDEEICSSNEVKVNLSHACSINIPRAFNSNEKPMINFYLNGRVSSSADLLQIFKLNPDGSEQELIPSKEILGVPTTYYFDSLEEQVPIVGKVFDKNSKLICQTESIQFVNRVKKTAEAKPEEKKPEEKKQEEKQPKESKPEVGKKDDGQANPATVVKIDFRKESGTFVVPSGVFELTILLVGGGGGGGVAGRSGKIAGGGGGSGAIVMEKVKVMPMQRLIFTIGNGGLGGDGQNDFPNLIHGFDGGVTQIEVADRVFVKAQGGQGGRSGENHSNINPGQMMKNDITNKNYSPGQGGIGGSGGGGGGSLLSAGFMTQKGLAPGAGGSSGSSGNNGQNNSEVGETKGGQGLGWPSLVEFSTLQPSSGKPGGNEISAEERLARGGGGGAGINMGNESPNAGVGRFSTGENSSSTASGFGAGGGGGGGGGGRTAGGFGGTGASGAIIFKWNQ